MPQVSVIIPTHNRAGFLPTAIDSVLKQSFQDFEVLVVDDASTDGTTAVREGFNDPRIHWLRHDTGRGGAAARNTGIVHAKGKYVAFLDDDDEWYPEKLARQMEVMERCGPAVGVIYTGYIIVDRTSKQERSRMVPSRRGDLYDKLMASNPVGGCSSVLLKRSCLERVGLFDESLPSFQDRDLWIRLAREFHFDYVQEPMLNYYVHSKKVWTNLDALMQGLEIMLEKYGFSPVFMKQCSNRYMEFGVKLCEANQIGNGRRALRRSIGLYPYRIKPYLYFFLTLLGPKVLTMVRENRAKVLVRADV